MRARARERFAATQNRADEEKIKNDGASPPRRLGSFPKIQMMSSKNSTTDFAEADVARRQGFVWWRRPRSYIGGRVRLRVLIDDAPSQGLFESGRRWAVAASLHY